MPMVKVPSGGEREPSLIAASVRLGALVGSADRFSAEDLRLVEHEVRLLDRHGQGLVINDREGDLTHANRAALDLGPLEWDGTHLARREGWKVLRRDGEVVAPSELPHWSALRRGRTVHRVELGLCDPAGEVTWLTVTSSPVRAPDGERVAVITTLSAPEEVRPRRSEQVHAAQPQAVVACDGEGSVTYLSSEAELLYGCRASEAIGQPVTEVVTWDLPVERVESLVSGRGRAEAWSGRVWVRRPDASCTPALLTIVPVTSPDGTAGTITIAAEAPALASAERPEGGSATSDELTGLATRRSFLDALQRRCSGRRSSETPIVLAVLKLEGLRIINDVESSAVGDQVIRGAARALLAATHVGDTAGRLSGTSFAVCFQPEEHASIEDYVARLRRSIELPIPVGSEPVTLRCSVGFAESSSTTEPADHLLQAADLALARARVQTRDASQVFDEDFRERLEHDQRIEAAIRHALSAGRVTLGYQPIVCLSESVMVGVEALIRLPGADGEVLPAWNVITVAEHRGLIGDLGLLILETACRAAASWTQDEELGDEDVRPLHVSVNVSAKQLDDPHLDAKVARVLAETGLDPGRLNLEMTESVLMSDSTWTAGQLARLKRLGVRLSADDFGTGYSSLAYLKRFPLDVIKADRSFVAGLPDSVEDVAVVHAIVGLADVLGLSVVAEGVETAEQLAALVALDCELGQGYLWSRAVPADEVLEVAREIRRDRS